MTASSQIRALHGSHQELLRDTGIVEGTGPCSAMSSYTKETKTPSHEGRASSSFFLGQQPSGLDHIVLFKCVSGSNSCKHHKGWQLLFVGLWSIRWNVSHQNTHFGAWYLPLYLTFPLPVHTHTVQDSQNKHILQKQFYLIFLNWATLSLFLSSHNFTFRRKISFLSQKLLRGSLCKLYT